MQFLGHLPPAEHIQADEPMPRAVTAVIAGLFALFLVAVGMGVWLVLT